LIVLQEKQKRLNSYSQDLTPTTLQAINTELKS